MGADRSGDGVRGGVDPEVDAVGDDEILGLAGVLDLTHDIAGQALGFELGRDVGVERDDSVVGAQRSSDHTLGRLERQFVLVGLEQVAADIDGAVIVGGPVAGSGGAEHGLHVLAEAGSQCLAVGAKDEGGEVTDLLGDVNVLNVEFVAEQVGEGLEGRRVATGDRDRRERETDAKTLILAKAQAGGGDVAQTVHRSDEAGVVAVGRGGGPCRQVYRRGHGVVAVAQS